jgi:beta-galactosidase
MKHSFAYEGNRFVLDGQPITIMSGAVHYFRTLPECWEDRLTKLKACGLNTVETYTCWNLHERREGEFDFSGLLDIEKFIETAEKLGLLVILRPGPYICAEWDFGGLPSWLLSYPDIALRCDDPLYLEKVKPYYRELLSRIRPHLCTNGGNVIMVQVENEYGSYGDDKVYLQKIVDIYRENGIDCLLFTSDGTAKWMLSGGTLPDVLAVANFGSYTDQILTLNEFQKDRPLMCGEFWDGWFDHWYEAGTQLRPIDDIIKEIEKFFDLGASFNLYMFHGGTNFAFWNGANHPGDYQPTITSYDYCAPLTEEGNITPKYELLRELLKDYRTDKDDLDIVPYAPTAAYGEVSLTQTTSLRGSADCLGVMQTSRAPLPMEQYGQAYGSILYRTHVKYLPNPSKLILREVHDRAHVFINGQRVGVIYRNDPTNYLEVTFPEEDNILEIIVENMGRINFGPYLHDEKGITDSVCIAPPNQHQFGWEVYPMELDDLSVLFFAEGETCELPAFFRGTFAVDGQPKDTYLRPVGFEHGSVWVNGFNLGRYWNSKGPQKTLYVPASLLREGENEIIVLEYDAVTEPRVVFEDKSDLG